MADRKKTEAPTAEAAGMKLEEYPTAIRAALADLHAAKKRLPALYDARKDAEDMLRAAIHGQHTNDKAREAAFRAQKEGDAEWATANAAEQAGLDRVAALQGEVEELRGKFAVAMLQQWAEVGSIALKPISMVLQLGVDSPTLADALKDSTQP